MKHFFHLFGIKILQHNDLRLLTLEIEVQKSKLNSEMTNSLRIIEKS